jgi:hypothetical protein
VKTCDHDWNRHNAKCRIAPLSAVGVSPITDVVAAMRWAARLYGSGSSWNLL